MNIKNISNKDIRIKPLLMEHFIEYLINKSISPYIYHISYNLRVDHTASMVYSNVNLSTAYQLKFALITRYKFKVTIFPSKRITSQFK